MIGEPLLLPSLPCAGWLRVWARSGVDAREPIRQELEQTLVQAAALRAGVSAGVVALRREPGGRPALVGLPAGCMCSFGYTHGLALAALAWGVAVGVDCEHLGSKADWRAVAAEFFQPGETAALAAAPDEAAARETFFRLWARKEALAKASGLGMRTFDVRHTPALPEPPTSVLRSWAKAGSGDWLIDLELGGDFAGCVAVRVGTAA